MRHDDPTINSILAADSELNELESAVFLSLLEFYDAYDNKDSAESLSAAQRNVRNRKSDYNLAAAQAISTLEHAFDYIRHGRTCWRECCGSDSSNLDERGVRFDPLGVMGTDIVF